MAKVMIDKLMNCLCEECARESIKSGIWSDGENPEYTAFRQDELSFYVETCDNCGKHMEEVEV